MENRKWSTSYRGPVLIHASLRPDLVATRRHHPVQIGTLRSILRDDARRGVIVGCAELVDVIDSRPVDTVENARLRQWFKGPYGLVFANAQIFAEPIPCLGALGFFVPDAEALERVAC